ncbi:hypothetical protein ABYF34_07220 [Buchananella felis]|uniref:hypothetical protein n=1 Tax=Buchananella felis TaxID=3231492 RepID=UPI003526ED37
MKRNALRSSRKALLGALVGALTICLSVPVVALGVDSPPEAEDRYLQTVEDADGLIVVGGYHSISHQSAESLREFARVR